MSVGAVLLLVLCSSVLGVGLGWFLGRRGAAAAQHRLQTTLDAAEAAAKSSSSRATQLRDELVDTAQKLDEQQARQQKAEESAARAAAGNEQLKRLLLQVQGELDQARQRAKSLGEDLERAHSKAPLASTLEALKNDPAVGPGQYETLRMMYEQFTAQSVIGKK